MIPQPCALLHLWEWQWKWLPKGISQLSKDFHSTKNNQLSFCQCILVDTKTESLKYKMWYAIVLIMINNIINISYHVHTKGTLSVACPVSHYRHLRRRLHHPAPSHSQRRQSVSHLLAIWSLSWVRYSLCQHEWFLRRDSIMAQYCRGCFSNAWSWLINQFQPLLKIGRRFPDNHHKCICFLEDSYLFTLW